MTELSAFDSDGVQWAIKGTSVEVAKVYELLSKATRIDGCLISHLKPNAKGYIYVSIGRARKVRANRLIYEATHGQIPVGQLVRHKCDQRNCIEPSHLLCGTAQDNSNDMVERGRQSRHNSHPDDTEEILETLNLRDRGFSYQEIADLQGLASKTSVMYRIRKAERLGLI